MKPDRISLRPLLLGCIAFGFFAVVLGRAMAGGSHFYAPANDPVVREECGSCHLAFSPAMLPASSWRRMMGELKSHFGDDASVEAQTAARITGYLVDNAADAGGRRYSAKLLRGVDPESAPQRITALPRWVREHRKIPAWEWRHEEVRTRANCAACHSDAERGHYDE